jgi:non-specific serine/threonine protein kinase
MSPFRRDGALVDPLLEQALVLAQESGDRANEAAILAELGEGFFNAGDQQRARACWEEAAPLFHDLPENPWTAFAPKNLGHLALLAGDSAQAAALLEEALAIARRIDHPWGIAEAQALLAELARAQGDIPHALALLAQSLDIFAEYGDQIGITECLTGIGRVAVMQQHLIPAVHLFGVVATIHDAFGSRQTHLADARDESFLASLRAALGDEAFDRAWAMGRARPPEHAVVAAGEVMRELIAARASAPARAAPRVPAGLTPRERDVLRLLAEGQTDREIAASLFFGRGTVQSHVGFLFAKLGVNARAEAAAVAVRRGLV